jgi:hypothetical protein
MVATYPEAASRDALIGGVGCPWCKYEGPYWVAPCAVHAEMHKLAEDLHLSRTIERAASAVLDAIREKLGLDPEDDVVRAVDDLLEPTGYLDPTTGQPA